MKTECASEYVELNGQVYPCTVSLTMDLVGGKWKAVILYHLATGDKRYSELLKQLPAITEMTLSIQLKQLEKDGLIKREVFGKKPPIKVVYSLSNFGISFIPVLQAITQWGNQVVMERGTFLNAQI